MNSRKRNIFSSSIAPTGAPPAEFSNPEKSRMRHVNNRRFVAADDNSADDSASPFAMFPPAATRKRGVALDENVLAPTPTPPSRAANNDDDESIYSPLFGKRRRRFAPAVVADHDSDNASSSTSLDADDSDPVINGDALAAAHINDVELDQPHMQLVPYRRYSWQEPIVLGDRRIVASHLKPSLLDLTPPYPPLVRQMPVVSRSSHRDADSDDDDDNTVADTAVAVDEDVTAASDALATVNEPPSPWMLMPIGSHGAGDGTRRFFELLEHAARISIVRVVPDDSTPLELLQTVDSWSPSFAQASSFLQQNATSFPNLNLNFAYENQSGSSRQLVASNHVTQNALWPTAAAFNRETNELVILVAGNRRQFPWAKVAQAFE